MSIVTMALYNPPPGAPMTARMLLSCRASRRTIIEVRRMLSETEISRYIRPEPWVKGGSSSAHVSQGETTRTKMPIPVWMGLAGVTTLWGTQLRTQGGDVHGTGDDDDPEIHGVDYVATVELEELVLDI